MTLGTAADQHPQGLHDPSTVQPDAMLLVQKFTMRLTRRSMAFPQITRVYHYARTDGSAPAATGQR